MEHQTHTHKLTWICPREVTRTVCHPWWKLRRKPTEYTYRTWESHQVTLKEEDATWVRLAYEDPRKRMILIQMLGRGAPVIGLALELLPITDYSSARKHIATEN
jgi:hypothetical protein